MRKGLIVGLFLGIGLLLSIALTLPPEQEVAFFTDIVSKSTPVVDVRAYGAIGNGTTDDTAAIQAAIDDASDGDILFFPGDGTNDGFYKVTSALNFGNKVLTLKGTVISTYENFTGTGSRIVYSGTDAAIQLGDDSVLRRNFKIENLGITLGAVDDLIGIRILRAAHITIIGCWIQGTINRGHTAIKVDGGAGFSANISIIETRAAGIKHGLVATGTTTTIRPFNSWFTGDGASGGIGVDLQTGGGAHFLLTPTVHSFETCFHDATGAYWLQPYGETATYGMNYDGGSRPIIKDGRFYSVDTIFPGGTPSCESSSTHNFDPSGGIDLRNLGDIYGYKQVSKTANYTATLQDSMIAVDTTSAAATIELPITSAFIGKQFTIYKSDTSANAVILDPTGAYTIDGLTTVSLVGQYRWLTVRCQSDQHYKIMAGSFMRSGWVNNFGIYTTPTPGYDLLKIGDSAGYAPMNITARSAAPTTPATNSIYLDDGTNTASGKVGWRRWTGSAWADLNNDVSDTAYAASWDGVVDVAPSKNAVYDKIQTIAAGILNGSATWDPGSIAVGAMEAKDITITGAAMGDFCLASFSLDVTDLVLNAQVTAADTVTAVLANNTGGAVDLASGTLYVRVLKR